MFTLVRLKGHEGFSQGAMWGHLLSLYFSKTQNFSVGPQKLGPGPGGSCSSSERLPFIQRAVGRQGSLPGAYLE